MKLKVKFSENNSQFKSKFNEKINIGSKPINIDETLKLENDILSVNILSLPRKNDKISDSIFLSSSLSYTLLQYPKH